MTTQKHDLIKRFTYHPPQPGQPERYQTIRDAAKNLAFLFHENCPISDELDTAVNRLEEAVMWANASIARNEDM